MKKITIHYGVLGKGLLQNNALLLQFLQSYQPKHSLDISLVNDSKKRQLDVMLGWGRKKSFYRANRFAKQQQLAMLTLEDGFLRSLDSGTASRHACSMVIDPIGIYFDAKAPSFLEQLIVNSRLSQHDIHQAKHYIQLILQENLSKYNTTAKQNTLNSIIINPNIKNILLIDQVAGDQSITGAGASKKSFAKMLNVAQRHHPNAQIWIKAHPAGKQGYLTTLKLPDNVRLIRQAVNPIEFLRHMDEVYTVSSHMGFEALMLGKTVHCFGVAWYAGWGLTNDNYAPEKCYQKAYQRRGQQRKQTSIEDLFFACYLQYSHYCDPATGQFCQIHQVIQWLITNRQWRDNFPKNITLYQISFWKNKFIQQFLATSQSELFYKPKIEPRTLLSSKHFFYPKHHPFLIWGLAKKKKLLDNLINFQKNPEIWCLEDGFIRSNGLGANLIAPLSVVMDKTGIYYNAVEPSDLEHLLIHQPALTKTQRQRVQHLIENLLNKNVSKYNVGQHQQLQLNTQQKSHKILVVGQVEDDLSVQYCASDIKTNLDLLKTVRQKNQQSFIVYKPHPDVQAGLRTGKISDEQMQQYADLVVTDISLPICLQAVDELHTISSLSGFEALLRSKKVVCYGLPFYAGWGLTQDLAQNMQSQQTLIRRQQRSALTLEELVYHTLISYPLYHLPHGYGLAQVENVINHLYQNTDSQPSANLSENKFVQQAKTKFMQQRQRFLQYVKKKS